MSEIVERTREDRFEEMFREHYGAVRGYALRRIPGDLAQDAVAETFLVAWRRLDDFPADPLPWLFGVARRVLANQRRSADRSSALERRLAATDAAIAGNDPGEMGKDRANGSSGRPRIGIRAQLTVTFTGWNFPDGSPETLRPCASAQARCRRLSRSCASAIQMTSSTPRGRLSPRCG